MLDELKALRKKCLYLEFSGPYFPTFRLNMEIYLVNLGIHHCNTASPKNSTLMYFPRNTPGSFTFRETVLL